MKLANAFTKNAIDKSQANPGRICETFHERMHETIRMRHQKIIYTICKIIKENTFVEKSKTSERIGDPI